MTSSVLIVDPIFRGSRLFYSWMAYRAFEDAGFKPRILTRTEIRSEGFDAYFDDDSPIDPVVALPQGFWYGKIAEEHVIQIVDAIETRLSESDNALHVHFSGLDELFPHMLDALAEHFTGADGQITFSFVHYDARYLLSEGAGFLKMRAKIQSTLEALPGMRMLLLDDRLERATPAEFADQVLVMPDPAPLTPDSIANIQSAHEKSTLYDQGDARIKVVALGRQSDRKGLLDVIRAARMLSPSNARLYVSGPLESDQERYRTPLTELTPDPIVWRDDYVAEDEVRLTYRDADYVLLPYDKSFEGSSGVFSHAAAFGKPIISTDHGCIGYRIKNYKLGFTYPAGRHEALADILSNLPKPQSDEYRALQHAMAQYEAQHNMAAFSARLVDIVNEAQREARNAPPATGAPVNSSIHGHKANQQVKTMQTTTLQEALEENSTAPEHLDYKQVVLFDTSVSSKNIGDQIIMESIRPLLRMIFPKCIFVNVPTHEYTGTEALKLLEQAEHSFVCGTNLLASHVNDYKQWKLQGTDAFLLRNLTLFGVGWWQYQDAPNAYTQFLYKRILSDTAMHSVRDGYTKKQLAAAGVTNVFNTSCPTTWRLTRRHLERIPREPSDTVVFTFTDYAKNPGADQEIIETLSKKYKNVYCWLQGANDYAYAKTLSVDSVKFIAPTLEAYTEFLEGHECDYVGTRLHGGIRALQAGRRALILAVDNRATEISEDIGLPVIQRNSVEAFKKTLNDGWDIDIHVPYAEIDAWVKQFGHSHDFSMERLIDRLIYKFPDTAAQPVTRKRPTMISISGAFKRPHYAHYQIKCRDPESGGEMAFLVFRTNDAIGINIRPGKEGAPSADLLSGIDFTSDDYGEFLQLRFLNADGSLVPSAELGGNGDKLLGELERYLRPANAGEAVRLTVRPEIDDHEDATGLFLAVAEKFMAQRR